MKPNAEQQAAIDATAPEVVLIAGPGSGKTTTVIQRIKRQIFDGVEPGSICAVTYTNAGADNLAERIAQEADGARLGFVGTLHGLCLRILGQVRPGGFAVLDQEASEELLKATAAHLGIKLSLKDLVKGKATGDKFTPAGIVGKHYRRTLDRIGATDFELILVDALAAIKAGATLPGIFHLYVDELQDSSAIDLEIYRALPMASRFYVGDPDQGIFGFRGGCAGNVLEAAGTLGTANLYLSTNYRSGTKICAAANTLIQNNRMRGDNQTIAATQETGAIHHLPAASDVDEAIAIRDALKNLIDGGHDPSEIAVLSRFNRQVDGLASIIRASGIPIKQRVAPTGAGGMELAVKALGMMTGNADTRAISQAVLNGGAGEIVAMVARGEQPPKQTTPNPPRDAIELYAALTSMKVPERSAMQMVGFVTTGGGFDLNLGIMQGHLMIVAGTEPAGTGVFFGTIHASKGLEFQTVIVSAFEDELLPGNKTGQALEEERRIAYVAATRAKRLLILSYATRRTGWGNTVEDHSQSRFLAEMGLATIGG